MNMQTLLNAIEKYIEVNESLEQKQEELSVQFPDMAEWGFKDERWEVVDATTAPYQKAWKEARAKMFDINVKYCARYHSQFMARKLQLVQKEKPSVAAQLLIDLYNKP